METTPKVRWYDGRMVQGAYLQHLEDTDKGDAMSLKALRIIIGQTLRYKKRYAYIKSDLFGISDATRQRQIQKLRNMGLLEYHITRGYTMFRLVLPKEIENNTVWVGGDKAVNSHKETPTEETITKGFVLKQTTEEIEESRRKAKVKNAYGLAG